jgi:hypothetical protein
MYITNYLHKNGTVHIGIEKTIILGYVGIHRTVSEGKGIAIT